MTTLLKIEQVPDFGKDSNTGAVVNTNGSALRSYKARRKAALDLHDTKARLSEIETELRALKDIIAEIKKK